MKIITFISALIIFVNPMSASAACLSTLISPGLVSKLTEQIKAVYNRSMFTGANLGVRLKTIPSIQALHFLPSDQRDFFLQEIYRDSHVDILERYNAQFKQNLSVQSFFDRHGSTLINLLGLNPEFVSKGTAKNDFKNFFSTDHSLVHSIDVLVNIENIFKYIPKDDHDHDRYNYLLGNGEDSIFHRNALLLAAIIHDLAMDEGREEHAERIFYSPEIYIKRLASEPIVQTIFGKPLSTDDINTVTAIATLHSKSGLPSKYLPQWRDVLLGKATCDECNFFGLARAIPHRVSDFSDKRVENIARSAELLRLADALRLRGPVNPTYDGLRNDYQYPYFIDYRSKLPMVSIGRYETSSFVEEVKAGDKKKVEEPQAGSYKGTQDSRRFPFPIPACRQNVIFRELAVAAPKLIEGNVLEFRIFYDFATQEDLPEKQKWVDYVSRPEFVQEVLEKGKSVLDTVPFKDRPKILVEGIVEILLDYPRESLKRVTVKPLFAFRI